jgi:metal-dependent hydrolase (beta-lactamase superfamily II)
VSIKFEFLPNAGEAILITIDNKFTILMDGGNSHPFRKKFSKLKMPIPKVDMVIVTHIDRDHIGGIIRIFEDKDQLKNIKYLLFNEPERCNLFHEPNDSAEVNGTDGNSLLNLLKKPIT